MGKLLCVPASAEHLVTMDIGTAKGGPHNQDVNVKVIPQIDDAITGCGLHPDNEQKGEYHFKVDHDQVSSRLTVTRRDGDSWKNLKVQCYRAPEEVCGEVDVGRNHGEDNTKVI